MKKIIYLLLYITPLIALAGHDEITVQFKDRTQVIYRAKELWTYFNIHDKYELFNEKTGVGNYNEDCICVADYCLSGWHDDYIADFTALKNKIEALGKSVTMKVNYVESATNTYYWYYLTLDKNEISDIYVNR